jgi:hypothetical protein
MFVRTNLSLGVVLLVGSLLPAAELKSGPQVGDRLNGGFSVQFLNGMHADKKRCPV